MAKEFTYREGKRTADEYRDLFDSLKHAVKKGDEMEAEIRNAASDLKKEAVLQILREVDIDEIRANRIRYKILREHGYRTIADLDGVKAQKIASINGIGEATAKIIHDQYEQIYSYTENLVRIRISSDNRTTQYTRLVKAIAAYLSVRDPLAECRRLYKAGRKETEEALSDLSCTSNWFKWVFASEEKKKKAEKAYHSLKRVYDEPYVNLIIDNTSGVLNRNRITDAEAWNDFERRSILFFNILEDLSPGTLGMENPVYGLDEELAEAIRNEPVSTAGLKCELRKYQLWGVKYILHQRRVLLGDEMGLGKTVQAIAAMVSLHNAGEEHFMVVCPAGVLTNWCRELKEKSILPVYRAHGKVRDAVTEQWMEAGGVLVTTYETAGTLPISEELRIAMLTVDEAHYIKNPNANRTMKVRRLSEQAERLLFMTGTALENRVDEMIMLVRILNPEIASRLENIKYLSAAPAFRRQVAPVYFRRKREDVLAELPELIESREWCTLGEEEEAVYEDSIFHGTYADCRRVSWNVDDMRDSSKARRLLELAEEAEEDGRKLLVFSFFLDTISAVVEVCRDRCMMPLTGAIPSAKRQEIIDAFEQAPAGTILPAQIVSGGTGLNIQSASVVVICEPQLKPSVENQAISRAYRMGQTRNVLVFRLLCDDTIDERIMEMLEEKQMVFDAFADTSDAALKTVEIDETTLGTILKEEAARIEAKHQEEQDQ